MRSLIFLFITLSFNAIAQESIDIDTICNGKTKVDTKRSLKKQIIGSKELIVVDEGFCAAYLESKEVKNEDTQNIEMVQDIEKALDFASTSSEKKLYKKCGKLNFNLDDTDQISKIKTESTDKWKIRFYASHSFTTYYNSDIEFRSSRYNVDIKDYAWVERSSRKFFSPKTWMIDGNNPAQIIDEPTNTFVLSLEKNGHEFFLSAFHPKFFHDSKQVKYMKGTIDGVEVDGEYHINRPFDGYNQDAGEMELARNQNTGGEMTFEIGYGHRFKLIDTKFGNITYVPSVAVGVTAGSNLTVIVKEDQWWDFDDYKEKFTVQGLGGSITNRLEFNSKNERVGLFYENKLSYFKQEHGFLDGTQKYDLMFQGNSFGVKFMIHNPKNKKPKKIKLL
jgi:hypothetical protein